MTWLGCIFLIRSYRGLLRALLAFEANISDEDLWVISVSIDAFCNADLSLLPFEILCRWSWGERLVIPLLLEIWGCWEMFMMYPLLSILAVGMVLHLYWKYEWARALTMVTWRLYFLAPYNQLKHGKTTVSTLNYCGIVCKGRNVIMAPIACVTRASLYCSEQRALSIL